MSNRNGPSINHRQLGQAALGRPDLTATSGRKSLVVRFVGESMFSREALITRINEFIELPNDDKQFSIREGSLPDLQCEDGHGLLVIPGSVLVIDDRMTIVTGTVPTRKYQDGEHVYLDSQDRFVLAIAGDAGIVTFDA